MHFTPTSASSLNQVDRWFATFTEKCIRRDPYRFTRQIEQAIKQWLHINKANTKPSPLVKSADDIVDRVERFCLRTSNSRHEVAKLEMTATDCAGAGWVANTAGLP